MFQVSNPLRFYAANPNIDDTYDADGVPADVPNLTESQHRLKRYNKITNYIIYGCALFLLAILVLTIGITIWKAHQGSTPVIEEDEREPIVPIPDPVVPEEPEIIYIEKTYEETVVIDVPEEDLTIVEKHTITEDTIITIEDEPPHPIDPNLCPECLDYHEIVKLAELNPRSAETYITSKIGESTNIDLDTKDDERISRMENFVDRMATIPRALEEINRFLNLNKTFAIDLTSAEKIERDTHQLRQQYERKVDNIGGFTVKALQTIGDIGEEKKQKEKLEKEMAQTRANLNNKIRELEDEKFRVESELRSLRAQIEDFLRVNNIASESEISNQITKRNDLIKNKQKEILFAERKITTHSAELRRLELELHRLTDLLETTKIHLTQYQWVSHILQTISKFEDVRRQVRELLANQLVDGKDSFNKLIHSLQAKEHDYLTTQRNLKKPTESRSESTTVSESGTVKKVVSYISTRETDIVANLKVYIEKEQKLLKVWSQEQFKTLKVSTEEIRNLTTTINNLRERIKHHSGEYEKQSQLVQTIESNITITRKGVFSSSEEVQIHKDAIIEANEEIAKAQAELTKLNDLLAKLKGSSGESAKKEARLLVLKGEIDKEKQYLAAMMDSLEERIQKVKDNLRNLEDVLRRQTAELNGAIDDEPKPYDVETRIGGYIKQIKKSNEDYQTLLHLLTEISRILC